MRGLTSPLDSRFGAKNITSPNSGAYGNPYTGPSIKISHPFNQPSFPGEEQQALRFERPNATRQASISKSIGSPSLSSDGSYYKTPPLPPYSASGIPTHQAYIPTAVPESPATTIDSSNNYQLSDYSTPKVSPSNLPPQQQPNNFSQTRPYSPPSRLSPSQTHSSPEPSPPYVRPFNTQVPARSFSRQTQRTVVGLGLGSAITSQSPPVDANSQAGGHNRRFDFEIAARERRDNDLRNPKSKRRKAVEVTPDSAESEEQWPGSY